MNLSGTSVSPFCFLTCRGITVLILFAVTASSGLHKSFVVGYLPLYFVNYENELKSPRRMGEKIIVSRSLSIK